MIDRNKYHYGYRQEDIRRFQDENLREMEVPVRESEEPLSIRCAYAQAVRSLGLQKYIQVHCECGRVFIRREKAEPREKRQNEIKAFVASGAKWVPAAPGVTDAGCRGALRSALLRLGLYHKICARTAHGTIYLVRIECLDEFRAVMVGGA